MEELFKRFLDVLPVPYLLAVVALAGVAWIVKELRPGSEYGDVLRDRIFRRAALCILALLLIFVAARSIWTTITGRNFLPGERGICVAEFNGDRDDVLQRHTLEQLRTVISEDPALASVRVEAYPIAPASDSEARRIADRHHAVATIWGSVISGFGANMVQFEVTPHYGQPDIRKFCPKYPDITDFTQGFVAFVKTSVPPAASAREDTQNAYVQQQLQQLRGENERLAARVNQLQGDIASVTTQKGQTENVPAQDVRAQRRFGLFVGINDYKNMGSQFKLMFPSADARAMAEAFRATSTAPNDVVLLVDSDATRDNVLSRMADISKKVQPGDQVWLYFAGLGFRYGNGESSYMAMADTQAANLQSNSLSSDELRNWVDGLKATQVMVLLDACYSGFGIRHRGISTEAVREFDDSRAGRVLLAASQADQFALEDRKLGHGLFTYFLLQGLSGKADLRGRGYVTSSELFTYVRVGVVSSSPYQDPYYAVISGSGDFTVAEMPSSAKPQ